MLLTDKEKELLGAFSPQLLSEYQEVEARVLERATASRATISASLDKAKIELVLRGDVVEVVK